MLGICYDDSWAQSVFHHHGDIQLTHLPKVEDFQKVRSTAVDEERRSQPPTETTLDEKHQLSGLSGSMNLPVTQVILCGSFHPHCAESVVRELNETTKKLLTLESE